MYHPTTRVLTVLELLQAHKRISGPELAARLEVDVRSIRRYILMLQDLGIPIESETGRHGGYSLRPGFKLPPLMFSDDEALAVSLGLLAARQIGLAAAAPAIEGALAKIERVLPLALQSQVRATYQELAIAFQPVQSQISSSLLSQLAKACNQQHQVEFYYASARSEALMRRVDLYGVACYEAQWYAVGYCHLRQAVRVFRIDRISQLSVSPQRFERPHEFDTIAYLAHSFASIPDRWQIEVLLESSIEQIRSRLPHSLVLLEPCDHGVILRASLPELKPIARLLLQFGCPIHIRQPTELRHAFRELAEEALKIAA
jgi:predicted DNA-binding transcriptional regulator YafY